MKENVIEWLNGQDVITVTLSQSKYINKVLKLADKYSDVIIEARNDDGSILAKLPLKYLKLSPPKQMSEEQREKARERFKTMHSNK